MGYFVTKFYFTKSQSFVEYSPNTCECNVCGIKFEKKVMRFFFIVSSKEVCCQLLLTITCIASSSTSLTCAMRCIISVYCINHSLDKHSF